MADETVLWLNGPFGVGKTTVARLLTDRRVVDPERIGFVMKRTFWRGRDYQGVPLWRRLTVRQVARAARKGPIVVPMTIVRRDVLAGPAFGEHVDATSFLRRSCPGAGQDLRKNGRSARFEVTTPGVPSPDAGLAW